MAWALLLLASAGLPAAASPQAPAAASLPQAADWKAGLEHDILPFWQTPAALGTPIGNFPTFRCNDGTVYDPSRPCAAFRAAPGWISSAAGRQYVRMMSRQIYLYGAAFHLTGEPKYLDWMRAGVRYLLAHAFDAKTGNVVSYWQGTTAVAGPGERSSQDLAYGLIGLSFYYYLTRDPAVLAPILKIERFIREHYYDPRQNLYRLRLAGPDASRLELAAQLDQANAYMLLLTPLLPQPDRSRWQGELGRIAETIRSRFYDPRSAMFIGSIDPKTPAGGCIFSQADTDFGHTIKTYWMLYFIGRLDHDPGLVNFVRRHAPGVLRRAYLPDTGSWATQPTCKPAPADVDRTSTWWIAAELDQTALTLGITDRAVLRYIPQTFAFWRDHMVDHRYGEVWDEVSVPGDAPRLPKVYQWKNGFHPAEHALVGYIATSATRRTPVTLYYAFQNCKLPAVLKPYYFDGRVSAHTDAPLPDMPGACRVSVTFADVH